MCGIYGVVPITKREIAIKQKVNLSRIYLKSRRRGKDSSGLVTVNCKNLSIFKNDSSGKIKNLRNIVNALKNYELILGHTRLSTHSFGGGAQKSNQPLISGDWLCIHNGILTNYKELREKLKQFEYSNPAKVSSVDFKSDTHVLVKYIDYFSSQFSIKEMLKYHFLGEISVVLFNKSTSQLIIFSNNRNLYIAEYKGFKYISSEKIFFPKSFQKYVSDIEYDEIILNGEIKYLTQKENISSNKKISNTNSSINSDNLVIPEEFLNIFQELFAKSITFKNILQKCTKCGLPESFPHIYFDAKGKCQHCVNFKSVGLKDVRHLVSAMTLENKNRKVLVCLSGGRDSCYALHKVKELGLEPIAFTYDWGFISEAARENMAKMCGKLEIQHILVSPNLYKTRLNVRKTLNRWIKTRDVSLIPILMSQDKAFYFYANKIAKELGNIPIVLADHQFEKTNFKSLLAGSKEDSFNPKSGGLEYRLNYKNIFLMILHFSKSLFRNPSLIFLFIKQASISGFNYYLLPHNLIHIFEYLDWNESEVEEVLRREYGWGVGIASSKQSWRMGDITSPFYNLIYRLKLGFDEHDTMTANLVRADKKKLSETITQADSINNAEQVFSYLKVLEIDPVNFMTQIRNAF